MLADRALVQAARQACMKHGLKFVAFSEDWVIRMRGQCRDLFIYGYSLGCNSQACAKIATDKVATFLLLQDAAVPAVPHYLLKTQASPVADRAVLEGIISKSGRAVVKPLEGGSGAHIASCLSAAAAARFMKAAPVDAWAVSPYIEIVQETRIVVFRGAVRLAYKKTNPQVVHGLPMFNLGHGARHHTIAISALDGDMRDMALAAMRAIGLMLGAVDIVTCADGHRYVLEVNSAFSLEYYAAASKPNRKEVVAMYSDIFDELFVGSAAPRSC